MRGREGGEKERRRREFEKDEDAGKN